MKHFLNIRWQTRGILLISKIWDKSISEYLILLDIKLSFRNCISDKEVKLGRPEKVDYFFLIPSKIQGKLLPKHIISTENVFLVVDTGSQTWTLL